MNKTFNAVALANKALRAENKTLWEENETVRRGTEEMKSIYIAMITQLLCLFGDATLPKMDVKALMETYYVETQYDEDGTVHLRLREVEHEPEHQD